MKHIGSTFESFLEENGIRERVEVLTAKKIITRKQKQDMKHFKVNGPKPVFAPVLSVTINHHEKTDKDIKFFPIIFFSDNKRWIADCPTLDCNTTYLPTKKQAITEIRKLIRNAIRNKEVARDILYIAVSTQFGRVLTEQEIKYCRSRQIEMGWKSVTNFVRHRHSHLVIDLDKTLCKEEKTIRSTWYLENEIVNCIRCLRRLNELYLSHATDNP